MADSDQSPIEQTTDPENRAERKVVSSSARTGTGRSYTVTIPSLRRPSFLQRANRRAAAFVLLFFIVAILGGLLGSWVQNRSNDTSLLGGNLTNQQKVVTSQSQLINAIAKEVGPSVVSVNVNITTANSNTGGFGLFGFTQPEQEQAAGTGIIISSSGIIMTNRHVVPAGTTSVSVTLSNGTELKDVSVIGRTSTSSSLDLAFLKINNLEGQKLTPAVIGNSSDVQVGDAVVAIGNALGQFQNTVTSGIISGYGRSVQATSSQGSGTGFGSATGGSANTENLDDLFQTDAAINEGNSGGPLVNMNGQVIGINTAIAGNAQNIGFSIPINDAKGLIQQVLKTGKFAVPYLGVRYIPLTSDVASEYHLPVQAGAFIAPSNNPAAPSVVSGSPADKAGLQTNDIITQVDGTNVDATHSLTSLLDQHSPGDTIPLSVNRQGKSITVHVTLGTAPSS